MCLYCKHLKELMLKEEARKKKAINEWRFHVERGDKLMQRAIILINKLTEHKKYSYEVQFLLSRMEDWINTVYVGK